MREFGLIGLPLGHSFSKKYFTEKFERESLNDRYDLFELGHISEFEELIKKQKLTGLNVTIPYKEQIIPYLDEMDDAAAEIGAVNVIKFIRDESQLRLKGYNSDYIGFAQSIEPFLKSYHHKALILGTGGASKAVEYALKKRGLEVSFVSRSKKEGQFSYEELNREVMRNYQVIVNCTPLGTFPNVESAPDIPYHFLSENHLLYDLVYNPSETSFMKKGKEQGAQTVNGEEMLILQAEEAWKIWNKENEPMS